MEQGLIKLFVIYAALTGGIAFGARAQQSPDGDVATPEGLPAIGKWMLTAKGVPSDWLGEIYEGKNLREPINVIIIDQGASSADDAKTRLLTAAARAGYPIRFGHSTGYQGSIAGRLYPQLPQGRDDAFSNDLFEVSNNHGRIFGPHEFEQGYLFTAAFSREEIDPFRDPPHSYGSFNRARDDFTQRLDRHTDYEVSRFVDLGNALIGNPKLTTGDHDGIAVVVRVGP
ncbi:hypothetical protein [Microvirga sp. VF16]|uniref:hypothetical protein n=1 Tax=Microvirga sp. VF16 TaxID=2807101 RepID=UPI00193DE8DE|nr:hypothetical protein [Microvirga sp. VF16]QRM28542.1 hypothetical protein JO965_20275 [Microvirga sp. VF16]